MKKFHMVFIALVALLVIRCAGVADLLDAPLITNVSMDEVSVTIIWATDTIVENHIDFQGYNIYVSTDSSELLIEDGEDLNKINPDVIDENTYTISGLSQDSIYYIQVRTLNTEDKVGGYNDSLPVVAASPRPEFIVTMKLGLETQVVNDSSAIKFSDATIMADSAMANGGADMWAAHDSTGGTDNVNSPITHPQYGANARITLFVNMGQRELDDVSEVTTVPNYPGQAFSTGDLIVAKTEDGNYLKIHVDALLEGYVTITYAYQNISDFPYF